MTPPPLVLILEDEWVTAAYLLMLLEKAGYRVLEPAEGVNAAHELANQQTPNLAVLDIGLGGEKSFALARILRERSIPVVLIVGHSPMQVPDDLQDCPAIHKPIDRAPLLACIDDALQAPPSKPLRNRIPIQTGKIIKFPALADMEVPHAAPCSSMRHTESA